MKSVFIVVGAALLFAAARSPAAVPVGGTLADAPLRGLNGPSRHLDDFRGKPLIINVWASWCGPCRAEMSSLERLAWLHTRVRFRIIGVSTDDYPDRARAFLRSSNSTISQFIDTRRTIENMLGASSIPLTVLVAADGRVLGKFYGARDWAAPAAVRTIEAAFGAGRPATPAHR